MRVRSADSLLNSLIVNPYFVCLVRINFNLATYNIYRNLDFPETLVVTGFIPSRYLIVAETWD